MSQYIAQAYPNDPKKRRQLTINMDNYLQNQAGEVLIEAWGQAMDAKNKSTYMMGLDGSVVAEVYDVDFDFENRAKKHYGKY